MSTQTSQARNARRQELIKLNSNEGSSEPEGHLDASLKRNTAFIKRLRGSLHLTESADTLIKEVNGLALEKYLQETIAACVEGAQRAKTSVEIWNAVEVISALHRRFGREAFSNPFAAHLGALLKPPSFAIVNKTIANDVREKDDVARIARQRPLLRLFGELEAVNVVRSTSSKHGHETYLILKDLLADKDNLLANIPLAIGFVKTLGSIYLPTSDEPLPGLPPAEMGVSAAVQEASQKLLRAYHSALASKAAKDHLTVLQTEQRNDEAYIRSGEIFEDRQAAFERLAKAAERGWAGLVSLSEALNVPTPEQPSLPTSNIVSSLINTGHATSTFGPSEEDVYNSTSLWADEAEKRFYEDIVDLRDEVPAALLGFTAKAGSEETLTTSSPIGNASQEPALIDSPLILANDEVDNDTDVMVQEPDDRKQNDALLAIEQSTEPLASGPAARLSDLFLRIPECTSKETIDQAAVDFAFMNSKASRNRLIKFLNDVPRTRLDVLPFYARLVKILSKYMPDVLNGILAVIEDDFRYIQKRKQLEIRELRAKTLHFLAELVKFGVVPPHTTLHAFKVFIDDLSRHNVDSLCILLENCGRYVLRQPSTGQRMQILLDILVRKKAAQDMTPTHVAMLDSAYYQCVPPERPTIVPKERSPMHLFAHHVLYNLMSRTNYDKAYKILRKFAWEDPHVRHILHNAFTKIWKAKYSNIALFALMLYDIGKYHPDFVCSVIDRVLENIRVGLERNNFRDNQQRVASIRYLAELYNFQSIESKLIFDTLWLLITFGHPEGRPMPDVPSAIDTPQDWFRIRLICTLLDATIVHLDHGVNKVKVDGFLTFFQLYIKCKDSPPMDIDFMYHDTVKAIRPKMKLAANFDEAAQAVDELISKGAQSVPLASGNDDAQSDQNDAALHERLLEQEEGSSDGDALDAKDDFEEIAGEEAISPAKAITIPAEDEAEFAREFARMMTDAAHDRPKIARAALGEVSLPTLKRDKQAVAADESNMVFTLLTKKGNKAHTRSLEIPKAANIAMQSVFQQESDKREQQQVKQLVLQQVQQDAREQAAAEKQALQDSLSRRGIKVKAWHVD